MNREAYTYAKHKAQTIKGNQAGTLHVWFPCSISMREAVVSGEDQMPEPCQRRFKNVRNLCFGGLASGKISYKKFIKDLLR